MQTHNQQHFSDLLNWKDQNPPQREDSIHLKPTWQQQ